MCSEVAGQVSPVLQQTLLPFLSSSGSVSVVVPVMSKKATKNTKDFRQYAIGDHVLGKVRGYPPWPGMVSEIVAYIASHKYSRFYLFFLPFLGC
jgi:hypothetical protein